MAETRLTAEARTLFGKGAARRIRRADKIPAVLYGHGTDPVHITLPGHETMLALKHSNVLLTIELDGKSRLALPKDVQRDPVRQVIEHVDLLIVRRGERVHVDVPVHPVGEPAPETMVGLESSTLAISAEATQIPQVIEVPVAGLPAGTQIMAGDIVLPAGAELVADADLLVVNISAAATAEAVEAELAEAESDMGVRHTAPSAEPAGATAEPATADRG